MNQLDTTETLNFKAYIKAQAKTGELMLLYHDGSTLWGRPAQDQFSLFGPPRTTVSTSNAQTTVE
jgi:hypothetical protein